MNKKKNQTVLIVEDDEATIQLLEIYVRFAGYKTLVAHDGRSALELVQSKKPSLVVLDLMLPELHGVAVCHHIKTNPQTKHIKVLVVSVKSFPADQKQVAEAGADMFMPKPLEKDEFIGAVNKLLGA